MAEMFSGDLFVSEKSMQSIRMLFIDNLRALVIVLVMVLHVCSTYGGEDSWYYKEGHPDIITVSLLTVCTAIIGVFPMGLLFLIAGYFTPASCDRKGAWRFLKDRLLRLGIPMLFFDFIIQPILIYTVDASVNGYDGTFRKMLKDYYSGFHIGTGPLWFVEALLIFTVVYVLWKQVVCPAAKSGHNNIQLPSNLSIAAFAIVLGLVTFAVRIWLPMGWIFEPLNLQLAFFPQYICLFVIGVAAYRHNWLAQVPNAMGRLWQGISLVFIIVLLPVLFFAGGAANDDISPYLGGLHWQCLAFALWEQFLTLAMIIALLVFFRERLNRQARLAKEMSAGAYTVYIIHAPVLVFFTLAIRHIDFYPLLKFAVVVIVTIPLCFAVGGFIRRLPLAKRIL
jgi:peptidoglycan/LPS O-acetylase OafA/YrhL